MADATTIGRDSVVTMEFTLHDEAGNLLDRRDGETPLRYLHGHGNIAPGLESALEGQAAGFSGLVTLKPEEGYGERSEERMLTVKRSELDFEPEEGMRVGAYDDEGNELPLIVASVSPTEVVLDGNHPLAGKTIRFDVKVLDVRPATEEELHCADSHAHGCSGCSGCDGEEE